MRESRFRESTPRVARGPRTTQRALQHCPKNSRFYWIAYMSGGKRRFESSESELKGEAQDLLNSLQSPARWTLDLSASDGLMCA